MTCKNRLVIGLSGTDGAGKSTLAEELKTRLRLADPDRVCRVMAYATQLRVRVAKALSALEYPIYSQQCSPFNKPTTPAMRKILEGFGELYRSMLGYDFFVEDL